MLILAGEHPGVMASISGGGLQLRTRLRLLPGDFIQFELPFLPEPNHREPCFAQVIRAAGDWIYGLRFDGMSQRMQAMILQFVRSQERKKLREESRRSFQGIDAVRDGRCDR